MLYSDIIVIIPSMKGYIIQGGGDTPCARARQAKRVLTQGRTGASRDKLLKMT